MKHYYSIANFVGGIFTKAYGYLYPQYNFYTNQQLFGQLTTYLKGGNIKETLNNLTQGIKLANFPYNWNDTTIRYIANEYEHCIEDLQHSYGWDSGAYNYFIFTNPLVKFISDWSTTTTITAGIVDIIDYYTNYNFLSWSSPIGLPNIIMQNVKQSYEAFSLQNVLVGGAGVAGLVAGLMIELGALGYACEIFMQSMRDIERISSLNALNIEELVEKYGIESIKPLNEAGAKFSDLHSHQIVKLVEKYGVEIKDKLLHPENIQNEIMSADIYIENLTDNSLEQVYENSAPIDNYVDNNITTEIESAYTIIGTDTFEAA